MQRETVDAFLDELEKIAASRKRLRSQRRSDDPESTMTGGDGPPNSTLNVGLGTEIVGASNKDNQ